MQQWKKWLLIIHQILNPPLTFPQAPHKLRPNHLYVMMSVCKLCEKLFVSMREMNGGASGEWGSNIKFSQYLAS